MRRVERTTPGKHSHSKPMADLLANSLAKSFDAQADRSEAVQRARLALNSDRPQDAERIADEILKNDPRHAQALHIRGCVLLMHKRPADAIAPLEAAALSLRDPETDTLLAMALREAGRPDEALARLKRATKRRPPYAPAFRELGYLLMILERYDEAVEALSRGLEIAPMMPQLSIQLGEIFLRRRRHAEAKTAFARALEISPASPEALFGMAKVYQSLGEGAAAADYYRRCLLTKPDDAATWLNLGHCLLALGQLEAGYGCFRTAARGDPKRYGNALTSLAASGRGRLWLKPSAAAQFLGLKR
jgi:tetratricopeptide (TPR) repeat protein